MKLLNNHVSIITGAASGIGFSIAKKFLENGARVVLNDRNAENLTKSEQSLTKAGFSKNNFFTKVGDVTYEDDMEKLFDECSERFSSCSLLVNNAGIVQEKPFMQISTNDWDQMLATHLKGCFLGCQYALRSMLKKKSGVIINIASQLGQIGGFELAHYSAAKAGIIGLTKSLAREYSKNGIRVNAIAPGPINTELILELSKDWRDKKARELPLGHFGEPGDVADTALFLASENARIYVGQTLGPNSGDVML